MFEGFLRESIVRRAADKGLCSLDIVDLRQHGEGKYRKIDDKPYGGGPGCLMMCAPWFAAVEDALSKAADALDKAKKLIAEQDKGYTPAGLGLKWLWNQPK